MVVLSDVQQIELTREVLGVLHRLLKHAGIGSREGLQLHRDLASTIELVELKIACSLVVHGRPALSTIHGSSKPERLLLVGVLRLLLLLLVEVRVA